MKGKIFAIVAAAGLCFIGAGKVHAADKGLNIGIVNFGKCITDSKHGKREQENFEVVKAQLQRAMQDLDAQLNETANKLQDPELLDSLSPEAEQELKIRFQGLNEELQRYQSQYYQVMQQANMRLFHTMNQLINNVSETIAKQDKLSLIINKEAAFHYMPALEITDKVISELDKQFDKELKQQEISKTSTDKEAAVITK